MSIVLWTETQTISIRKIVNLGTITIWERITPIPGEDCTLHKDMKKRLEIADDSIKLNSQTRVNKKINDSTRTEVKINSSKGNLVNKTPTTKYWNKILLTIKIIHNHEPQEITPITINHKVDNIHEKLPTIGIERIQGISLNNFRISRKRGDWHLIKFIPSPIFMEGIKDDFFNRISHPN